MEFGDYSALAESYGKYRQGYSESVLSALLGMLDKSAESVDAVDVGAGTGLWTRMLASRNLASLKAVEPNDAMRAVGKSHSETHKIEWLKGSGEDVPLGDQCCDTVSMASSFHWVDFEKGTREFHRVLRPEGRFVALWNPRLPTTDPLLQSIETYLRDLKPDMKRQSSGLSGISEHLTDWLNASELFTDVVYMEGRHTVPFSKQDYIGVWRSVNDIQVQLGEQKFAEFMQFIDDSISDDAIIEQTYLTRAWSSRKVPA